MFLQRGKFVKFSRMIQVSDSSEVKCKKSWVTQMIDLAAFSRFQTRCKNIECIGGSKKFVLFRYHYAPPKFRSLNKTPTSFISGTDVMAEHYLNSDEFRNFILNTFVDKSVKGEFYVYTRRAWKKDANGRNSLDNSLKEVVVQWIYTVEPEEYAEEYPDDCTAGRRDGICACCGTVTCM